MSLRIIKRCQGLKKLIFLNSLRFKSTQLSSCALFERSVMQHWAQITHTKLYYYRSP